MSSSCNVGRDKLITATMPMCYTLATIYYQYHITTPLSIQNQRSSLCPTTTSSFSDHVYPSCVSQFASVIPRVPLEPMNFSSSNYTPHAALVLCVRRIKLTLHAKPLAIVHPSIQGINIRGTNQIQVTLPPMPRHRAHRAHHSISFN